MLLDPRNDPRCDLAPFQGRRRRYIVASTPRTGSTLLCRALWDTGRVGAPKEYCNPMQLRDWAVRAGSQTHRLLQGPLVGLAGRGWSRARLDEHLKRVEALRTGPTGWFGMKVHRHHWERWGGFEAEVFLRIVRQDRVAQAVSWARARQTNRWADFQKELLRPRYSRKLIQRCLDDIERSETAWDRELPGALTITYEELVRDLGGSVHRVLALLDESFEDEVRPALARQGDGLNEEWAQRFKAG